MFVTREVSHSAVFGWSALSVCSGTRKGLCSGSSDDDDDDDDVVDVVLVLDADVLSGGVILDGSVLSVRSGALTGVSSGGSEDDVLMPGVMGVLVLVLLVLLLRLVLDMVVLVGAFALARDAISRTHMYMHAARPVRSNVAVRAMAATMFTLPLSTVVHVWPGAADRSRNPLSVRMHSVIAPVHAPYVRVLPSSLGLAFGFELARSGFSTLLTSAFPLGLSFRSEVIVQPYYALLHAWGRLAAGASHPWARFMVGILGLAHVATALVERHMTGLGGGWMCGLLRG